MSRKYEINYYGFIKRLQKFITPPPLVSAFKRVFLSFLYFMNKTDSYSGLFWGFLRSLYKSRAEKSARWPLYEHAEKFTLPSAKRESHLKQEKDFKSRLC